jgi:hypothetical protein
VPDRGGERDCVSVMAVNNSAGLNGHFRLRLMNGLHRFETVYSRHQNIDNKQGRNPAPFNNFKPARRWPRRSALRVQAMA